MKKVQTSQGIWIGLKITVLVLLLIGQKISAQTVYRIDPGKGVEVKVLGTSNVHDWTMVSTGIESQGTFKLNAKDELTGLSGFSFTVFAKTLKSGKSSMDSRTYKSILADEFPKIVFVLKSAIVNQLSANKFQIQATGNLSIAGASQLITLNVNAIVNADHSITCAGTEKIKLTDYKIDPPSFMLGAMKVGNDLTIKFELNYNKSAIAK